MPSARRRLLHRRARGRSGGHADVGADRAGWADPGWIGFHTPDEFRNLLAGAGFGRTAWVGLLPGFGLAVGEKPAGARS